MDLITLKLSFYVSIVLALCSSIVLGQENIFLVTDFGAIADRKTDNSAAFMEAWKKACMAEGGIVRVPGGAFLVKSASFEGPCIGETTFHVEGIIVAAPGPSTDEHWFHFHSADNLKILGNGILDGRGATAWPHKCGDASKCQFPISLKIAQANNVEIVGIKSLNSKGFHIHASWVDNLLVKDIDVRAPRDSPNTDGIHIARCNFVRVMNSNFSTGDDCVSIGDGSTNINITQVHCGPGHGISIGSLGKYEEERNVKGILVDDCNLSNTDNGLRIKTFAPSTAAITVSDVTFSNIAINNVRNPIIIDQYYCPKHPCSHSVESDIAIQDVKFINVKGTSATPVALKLDCSKAKPCQDIVLSGLDMRMAGSGKPTTANCSNADKNFVGDSQIPQNC